MISEIIEEWIKGILIDGITGNLSGLFDNVNAKVGEIAADVGATPQAWNSGIFNMLQNLSETVVLPIAAAILACVMCMELIQMITEKNNMHDFDSSMFFRWIFKSAFAILIVSNTWNIVMGIFDATQSVVNQSAGVIIGETSVDFNSLIPDLESQLEAMSVGGLLGLWFQTLVVGLTMNILAICIFLVTYGRMIEIYVVTSLGPIPLATMGNSEWRGMGQNYLKSLLALGFQAFLIMVVVGIYAVLIQNIASASDISGAIWGCMGYTVLLCFCLFKTGSISIPRDYGRGQFDAFCKKVLKNEARAYLRNMKRQKDRETMFSDLPQHELDKLCTVDRYPSDSFVFSSHGYDLHIDNELVAAAFANLPQQEQSILILYCVLDMADGEIASLTGMSRSAVQRHRTKTLKELRVKLMALMPEGG